MSIHPRLDGKAVRLNDQVSKGLGLSLNALHSTAGRRLLRRKRLGGAYRDRTDDPLLAKQVLSQLS